VALFYVRITSHPWQARIRSAAEGAQVDYNDDRELTRYVWDHSQRLFTEFEWRLGRAMHGRTKAAVSQSPELAGALYRLWGAVGDAEIEAALADGFEAFRRRVRDRLLAEHGPAVIVTRCPRCQRVVRTPLARQCFWCGFDWHSPDAEPLDGPADLNHNDNPDRRS
jgi:hypothetical protein